MGKADESEDVMAEEPDAEPQERALTTEAEAGSPTESPGEYRPLEKAGDPERGENATEAEAPALSSEKTASAIEEKLAELLALFKDRFVYDQGREQVISRLADQCDAYGDELAGRNTRPLLLDLLMLFDTLQQKRDWLEVEDPKDSEGIGGHLKLVHDELLEILERQDVRQFAEHLERLDPRRHRAVERLDTEVPEEDNVIARVVRIGFTQGDKILRPEEVVVKKYRTEL